jgi:hypothetical protein
MSAQFHPLAALLQGKTPPPYPLDRRLSGPQSLSGCYAEEKNLFFLPGIEPKFLSYAGHGLVTILTEFFQIISNLIYRLH